MNFLDTVAYLDICPPGRRFVVLEEPSSLLIEHDGFIGFE
jgi:hypothetical protein